VAWSPCSKGNPIARSVARHNEAITSAARTCSVVFGTVSLTSRTVVRLPPPVGGPREHEVPISDAVRYGRYRSGSVDL